MCGNFIVHTFLVSACAPTVTVTTLLYPCVDGVRAVGKLLMSPYCYGATTSGRSPWGGDTARRRFIGGGCRGRFSIVD